MSSLTDRLTNDGGLTIFLFHGVIERQEHQVRNYTRKHLPVVEFEAILAGVGRVGKAMSMDDVLGTCLSGEQFPRGAFAVTFDDGFENNLTVARPVLDRLGIPATVYVTSGFVDENGMSWVDRIEYAIEKTRHGVLRLPWSQRASHFANPAEKIAILNDIRRNVKSTPGLDVDGFVSDVFRQLDLEEVRSSDDQLDRKMTWDQVRSWRTGGCLVGGHSHTHAILSFLSGPRLEQEIDISLRMLKERTGIVASHYSYPEGLAHCYSEEVIRALKARGIACCPTAIDGTNRPGADPFHLHRVMVS
ncbi:polysaccharide deacetylase family protein [Afipia birgiae]|jgi:peptidoglycan/xylan/chitin deacetylase (PgdA/CDA1 family)|uniref:polysaccharide deacetylase family protein n=1 Tax=Afipia birgiae TaxID=151414 RepID=UPI000302099B|nr:polysaccharide deacetylase family protein [Afipia birgiae]